MAVPCRALRVLPLSLVPLLALSAAAGAVPATPQTILRSTYGIDGPLAVTAGNGAVTAWSGGLRGASVSSTEHRAGTALWPGPVSIVSGVDGGVWGTRLATNAAGDTLAVWMVATSAGDTTNVTIEGARRTGARTWNALPRVATIADAASMYRADLPRTPLDIAVTPDGTALVAFGTPDGSVTALRLAPGAAAWDAPVTVRGAVAGRLAPDPADLALAEAPDGTATLLWTETAPDATRSIGIATWSAGTWSPPASVPGSAGGYYPDVEVTPGGETIAAWTTPGGNWVATRPAGGGWSPTVRAGGGYSPEIAVGANRVAITWPSAGRGVALRNAPGGAWASSRAPVAPLAAAFDRGDRLLVAGRLNSGVLVWTRQTEAGAWGIARIASRQRDLIGVWGAAIAPSPAGPLATLIWAGNVREGRLGMPRGGAVLQGIDITATTGDPVGSGTLRLPSAPSTVSAYAVLSLAPRFTRYAGPTPVRIQTRRGGRWHTVAGDTADTGTAVEMRVGGPGRLQVRLAYGPGFRRITNAVAVTVMPTALRRAVAGWRPWAIAVSGRDLWVLSQTKRGAPKELRLLEATTGRLRRGPVRIGGGPFFVASLVETGGPVLIDQQEAGRRVLDAARPGLLGPPATVDPGGCTAAGCTPIRVTAAGVTIAASRSVGYQTAPLRGADGRVWGFGPGTSDEGGGYSAPVLESPGGGPPVARDAQGLLGYHGGHVADALAVDGGLWFRGALRSVLWVGTTGPGVAKGEFAAITGTGRCVWGLTSGPRPALVRLRQGAAPNGTPIPLSGVTGPLLENWAGPILAVAPRTGWVISTAEQTLVKIPLPAC